MNFARYFTAAAIAAAAVVGGNARADMIELKFGHVGAPGSLFAMSAEEFAMYKPQKIFFLPVQTLL